MAIAHRIWAFVLEPASSFCERIGPAPTGTPFATNIVCSAGWRTQGCPLPCRLRSQRCAAKRWLLLHRDGTRSSRGCQAHVLTRCDPAHVEAFGSALGE